MLVFLLNFYILMPMKHAESTMSSSEKTLEGQVAVVITPIPVHCLKIEQINSKPY
ncbi:hypothetical protein EfmAA96_11820 [Enterococcus faecium]|nr:hypothetical protein EfmAA96_11820 [Enterococcus faecium]